MPGKGGGAIRGGGPAMPRAVSVSMRFSGPPPACEEPAFVHGHTMWTCDCGFRGLCQPKDVIHEVNRHRWQSRCSGYIEGQCEPDRPYG